MLRPEYRPVPSLGARSNFHSNVRKATWTYFWGKVRWLLRGRTDLLKEIAFGGLEVLFRVVETVNSGWKRLSFSLAASSAGGKVYSRSWNRLRFRRPDLIKTFTTMALREVGRWLAGGRREGVERGQNGERKTLASTNQSTSR